MDNVAVFLPSHPALETERRDGPTDAKIISVLDDSVCRTEVTGTVGSLSLLLPVVRQLLDEVLKLLIEQK